MIANKKCSLRYTSATHYSNLAKPMLLLCVDDDPDDTELLTEAVNALDPAAIILRARNGMEALQVLNSVKPDYIFLDINMPIMGGKETLKAIRADSRLNHVPVCMLSTTIDTEEKKVLLSIGANRCVTKQNSLAGLCEAIQFLFHPN